MLNASTVMSKVSATLDGARTGRLTSPCAEKTAWKRSACSDLVGMPVDGPPRCTFTTTSGSSAIVARPSISVLSDMPGPEVAVIALRPANEAPDGGADAGDLVLRLSIDAAVLPDLPSRNCMISVDGVIG
jgi:hypothetical protein